MEVDEGVKGLSGGGDLAVSKFVVPLQCKRVSPGGGIGRRARFRCECSKDVQVRVLSRALHYKRESLSFARDLINTRVVKLVDTLL